jgi:hypothetical protein
MNKIDIIIYDKPINEPVKSFGVMIYFIPRKSPLSIVIEFINKI